jgi:hypothetical protein
MHRFVVDNEHIKGINGCVVHILQARDISERLHLISVYQVHVKLPYLFHLPKYKTKEGGEGKILGALTV